MQSTGQDQQTRHHESLDRIGEENEKTINLKFGNMEALLKTYIDSQTNWGKEDWKWLGATLGDFATQFGVGKAITGFVKKVKVPGLSFKGTLKKGGQGVNFSREIKLKDQAKLLKEINNSKKEIKQIAASAQPYELKQAQIAQHYDQRRLDIDKFNNIYDKQKAGRVFVYDQDGFAPQLIENHKDLGLQRQQMLDYAEDGIDFPMHQDLLKDYKFNNTTKNVAKTLGERPDYLGELDVNVPVATRGMKQMPGIEQLQQPAIKEEFRVVQKTQKPIKLMKREPLLEQQYNEQLAVSNPHEKVKILTKQEQQQIIKEKKQTKIDQQPLLETKKKTVEEKVIEKQQKPKKITLQQPVEQIVIPQPIDKAANNRINEFIRQRQINPLPGQQRAAAVQQQRLQQALEGQQVAVPAVIQLQPVAPGPLRRQVAFNPFDAAKRNVAPRQYIQPREAERDFGNVVYKKPVIAENILQQEQKAIQEQLKQQNYVAKPYGQEQIHQFRRKQAIQRQKENLYKNPLERLADEQFLLEEDIQ